MEISKIEKQLNDFNPDLRREALHLVEQLITSEKLTLLSTQETANLHCHTFFSFNAYGYSPTALAYIARKNGYKYMGIVDFDVLDGVDEFLLACDTLQVRASAGLETRVFLPEFSTRETNSPGEPGVHYTMAIGFISSSKVDPTLFDMRHRAAERNRAMVKRLNAYLQPVVIDYDEDVLPLTPAGTATERHILLAYTYSAEKQKGGDISSFWAEKLALPLEQVISLSQDRSSFQNMMRTKLMKKGGIGYVQPDAGDFPSVEDVYRMAEVNNALPCAAWLDGLSIGEQAMPELLDLLISKGAVALNIVPDRNWNIADGKVKPMKLQLLYDVVQLAKDYHLPLNIGTEMNSPGQKVMDDFLAPELAPVRQDFLDGAAFIYGHTMLARALNKGFLSDWAKEWMPERSQRNQFYQAIGRLVQPGFKGLLTLKVIPPDASPQEMLKVFNQ